MSRGIFVGLALIAGVAALVWFFAPSQEVDAAPPGCFCSGYLSTPTYWAGGATCAEARSNIFAAAAPYIAMFCDSGYGTCARSIVGDCVLQWDGTYSLDAHVDFRCWLCP